MPPPRFILIKTVLNIVWLLPWLAANKANICLTDFGTICLQKLQCCFEYSGKFNCRADKTNFANFCQNCQSFHEIKSFKMSCQSGRPVWISLNGFNRFKLNFRSKQILKLIKIILQTWAVFYHLFCTFGNFDFDHWMTIWHILSDRQL